jgi:hypothetical protein
MRQTMSGRQVSADVGGNLNIESVQDAMTNPAKQEGTGGGFSISQGGGSASLSRDTSDTNGTVAKLPDLNNLLDRQADMMAAASAAGEAVSRRIGDYAESKYKEAAAAGDQAGMDAWKEGGTARAEMQMEGAALVTALVGFVVCGASIRNQV